MSLTSFVEFVRSQVENAKPKLDCYYSVAKVVDSLPYNFFWVKNCFDLQTSKQKEQVIAKLNEIHELEGEDFDSYVKLIRKHLGGLLNLSANSSILQLINNIEMEIATLIKREHSEIKTTQPPKLTTLFVRPLFFDYVELTNGDNTYKARIKKQDYERLLPQSGKHTEYTRHLTTNEFEQLTKTIEKEASGTKISLVL